MMWSKKSEKLLDEIFEGKEEIELFSEKNIDEKLIEYFEQICAIGNQHIKNSLVDRRSILIIVLKNGKFGELDVTDFSSYHVKDILKDKNMFGYIISIYGDKLFQGKKIGEALIRTLYSPKLFRKCIIEIPNKKIINVKDRKNTYDDFDYYAINEKPILN